MKERHVNKLAVVVMVIVLCMVAFAAGHWNATRNERGNLQGILKSFAIWRESDWKGNAIRYAQIIKLIEAGKDAAAIDHACREIARSTKNILQVQGIIGDDTNPSDAVPGMATAAYEKSCRGKSLPGG